jgi:beta-N-acetylhexosaminidase
MNNLGQLIFTGISSLSLTDKEIDFIENENIGGVILFKENYESPAQLAELVNSIQKLRQEYPLFITTDHEGGRVIRFKTHFTHFPPMLDVASKNSPKLCFDIHAIMAEELAACGLNLNLSPVCDILNNPSNKVIGDRAFGKDHESVTKHISSAIRGLQTKNILACAKHFPGHGCTTKDSHHALPIVKKSLAELEENEFIPFHKAIKSRVEFVMMAHLVVDSIDPEFPCSLSPKAYELLRTKFKYNKIIITDDMQMKALTDNYSIGEAAGKAILAGADIIEYRDMEYAIEALEALKKLSKTKVLTNEDLNTKTERILKCKKTFLSDYTPVNITELKDKINSKLTQNFLKDLEKSLA